MKPQSLISVLKCSSERYIGSFKALYMRWRGDGKIVRFWVENGRNSAIREEMPFPYLQKIMRFDF